MISVKESLSIKITMKNDPVVDEAINTLIDSEKYKSILAGTYKKN